ncbi:hypothetical protein ACHOLT_11830 [Desulfitobacterium sp. Sab5]|uniref:hypothetical protein n=1 Tax=Desulfitobacterium nosdiversum TaxID=3375356 RepID=UPI003CF6791C
MKKWLMTLATFIFIVISLITPKNSHATDWIKLSAEDVIGASEVIVQGKYDLSGFEGKMADSRIWIPFTFRVDHYYKGSGSNNIDTAIQPFDMGWVKEHQEKNGLFVLFLERDNSNGGLLIPVGGPNGMGQMLNGTIQNQSSEDMSTYNEFLGRKAQVTPTPSKVNSVIHSTFTWYWLVLGLALVLGVLSLLRWLLIKRKSS